MAPDVLKATYEMLKEYQEQLNHHGSVEIFSESDCEQILEKVKSFYENKLAEKNELIETQNKIIGKYVVEEKCWFDKFNEINNKYIELSNKEYEDSKYVRLEE
ncbi:MAG: hypothetical protein SPLM_03840 [Spiroplasma phoeniceum]|uniref:hypothetical protein n=1 Tax=Spiroplasma phoeniceum TaxID=47835 RepID=UPI00326F252B